MQQQSSKYFDFIKDNKDSHLISNYLGWNSLLVVKFQLNKGSFLDNSEIDNKFNDLKGKQKIIVVVSGFLEIEIEDKKKNFKKFRCN